MLSFSQDLLEYKRKMRTLRVRMLDGSVKTMLVDDSQAVANLMVVVCTKIGQRLYKIQKCRIFGMHFENSFSYRNHKP